MTQPPDRDQTDIAQCLRSLGEWYALREEPLGDLLTKAADEIERLRARLQRASSLLTLHSILQPQRGWLHGDTTTFLEEVKNERT